MKTRTRHTLSGTYKIYVGASSSDIRLRGAVKVGGEHAAEAKKNKAENHSKELKYRLSAGDGKKIRKKRRWLKGVFIALLVASLAAFVAVGLFAWAKDTVEDYYNHFFIIGGVFALSVIALIVETVSHRKAAAKKTDAASKPASFKSPVLRTTTTQEVFEQAFGATDDGKQENKKNKFDEPKYFDRDFNFSVISKELETFTAERGCKMSADNTRRLVAAMAAARAIIFPAETERQMNILAPVLSEYLGSELYICDNDVFGDRTSSGVLARAVKESEKKPEKMFILLYRHVTAGALFGMVFSKTFDHASRLNKLGKQGDFVIPPNLWIIAVAAEGESINNLSADVTESVSLMNLEMTEVNSADRTTAVRPLGFYQFDNLCGGIRAEFEMSEGMWKRIDRFEEKLGEDVFLSVGNRTWIKMEKFAAAYLACGGEETDALDGAVATQLLVALHAVLYDKNIDSGQLISLLEEIFGENNIGYCRKIVNTYLPDGNTGKKGEQTL